MTVQKHTPGPWIARKTGGQGWPGQSGWAIDFNEDQEQVVDFVYEAADAKLIAAAPDLLVALQGLLTAYEDPGNTGSTHDDKVQAARAAIAKATQ